jgi:hypothetical protein
MQGSFARCPLSQSLKSKQFRPDCAPCGHELKIQESLFGECHDDFMKNQETARPLPAKHAPAVTTPMNMIQASSGAIDFETSNTALGLGDQGIHKATVFADFGGRQVTPLDEW